MVLKGKVIKGKNRGKKLGYPTANLKVSQEIKQGIYVSQTKIDSKIFKSATFIGNAKTFEEKEILIETYIVDFDENIYGKIIEVSLIKKIRENEKFSTIQDLKKQIKKDVDQVINHFRQ